MLAQSDRFIRRLMLLLCRSKVKVGISELEAVQFPLFYCFP
jgi:hypothetical protein